MKRRTFLLTTPLVLISQTFASRAAAIDCAAESADAIVNDVKIAHFSPRARLELVKAITANWNVAVSNGLVQALRIQHFMSQIATETGGLVRIEENLSYSSDRLKAVWPSRFQDNSIAMAYAHNPQGLAEYVYGGRLGNDAPGDGYRYRGSGYIQLTGKANFKTKTADLGLIPDAVQFPDQIRKPVPGFLAALKYWNSIDANEIADKDDVVSLRLKINGGRQGLSDARIWLARARRCFRPGEISPEEAEEVDVAELSAVKEGLQDLGLLSVGPDEADSASQTVEALQRLREELALPQKNLTGVSSKIALLILYDEDVLYALTNPDNWKTFERDNLR